MLSDSQIWLVNFLASFFFVAGIICFAEAFRLQFYQSRRQLESLERESLQMEITRFQNSHILFSTYMDNMRQLRDQQLE